MWLEHLLFGARFDTRLRGEFTRSVSPVQFSLFEIYGKCSAKHKSSSKYFFSVSRKTSDERRSNLVVVRSEDAKSDAETGEKIMKKSSLTSLRKDNEVKLEENY